MDRWEREWRGSSRDEIFFRVAVIAILASFALALVSTAAELVYFNLQRAEKTSSVGRTVEKKVALRPTIHPLKLLPVEIEGFETVTRQMMPGAEKYAAEAIYAPTDEDLSPAAPLNTYVKIAYHGSNRDALAGIRRALNRRYAASHQSVEISGQSAESGYEANFGSYYLGWVRNQYSIEIDTSYTNEIPAEKSALLSKVSQEVAGPINNLVQQTLRYE